MRDCEIYRDTITKTSYQWRCTKKEKERLLTIAAHEHRQANKVLSDALRLYDMMPEKLRNEKLYPPKGQIRALGW